MSGRATSVRSRSGWRIDRCRRSNRIAAITSFFRTVALFVAGYSAVMVETARRLMARESPNLVVDDHGARLERLFDALRNGLPLRP